MQGRDEFERLVGEAIASAAMIIIAFSSDDEFEDRAEIAQLRELRDRAVLYGLNFNELAHREGARALGVLFDLLQVKTDVGEAVSLTLGALGLGAPRVH